MIGSRAADCCIIVCTLNLGRRSFPRRRNVCGVVHIGLNQCRVMNIPLPLSDVHGTHQTGRKHFQDFTGVDILQCSASQQNEEAKWKGLRLPFPINAYGKRGNAVASQLYPLQSSLVMRSSRNSSLSTCEAVSERVQPMPQPAQWWQQRTVPDCYLVGVASMEQTSEVL